MTLRPSGTESTISSARTVSALRSSSASGKLPQAELAPVGARAGKALEDLLGRLPGLPEARHEALRFAVEREQPAGRGVEDRNPYGGGLDKGLQIGPRALLGAIGAGVRDGGRGLRGEEREDLLVFVRERLPAFLLREVEVADMRAPVSHVGSLEGARRQGHVGKAERTDVLEKIGDAKWPLEVPEVLEEPRPVGPVREPLVLVVAEARSDEVLGLSGGVDGGDGPVAGAGEGAGAFDDLAKDGLEVETFAHAKDRAGQGGDAFAMLPCIVPWLARIRHGLTLLRDFSTRAELPFPFATARTFQGEASGGGRSLS